MKILSKIIGICLLAFLQNPISAKQAPLFQKIGELKNEKCIVKVIGEGMVILQSAKDDSKRYYANNLTDNLKIDNLHISVNGDLGKIPPNVRLMGSPLRISTLKIDSADRKKHKLLKKYNF